MHVENATAGTVFDVVVVRAHTIRVYGRKVRPYFIASNLAAVIALIVSLAVLGRFPGIAATQFTFVFVGMIAFYRVALEVKGWRVCVPQMHDGVLIHWQPHFSNRSIADCGRRVRRARHRAMALRESSTGDIPECRSISSRAHAGLTSAHRVF